MTYSRRIISKLIFTVLIILIGAFQNLVFAADGQAIFRTYCASCHKPDVDYTGPMLKGAREREPSKDWVYKWVRNVDQVLATDAYAKKLFAQYKSKMTAFPDLKNEDIDAVLDWANAYQKPGAAAGATGAAGAAEEDNSLLYGLLTLILAIVALILLQVNSNLKKLSDEKQGLRTANPVPFYRNKAYLLMAVIILFLVGGYYTISGAIGLGRMQGYQPVQPIYYSHKVHAGPTSTF